MNERIDDSSPPPCSTLTRCEICKQDCGTMAGLIVHVRKYHPESNEKVEAPK